MSSLWTPGGEHEVPQDPAQPETKPSTPPPAASAAGEEMGPDEKEMLEVAAELLGAPIEDVLANHCFGLFELAALHLSQKTPNTEAARAAIDAMGYLVEGLGPRLGQHRDALAEGLNQARLAFVKIKEGLAAGTGDGAGPAEPAG